MHFNTNFHLLTGSYLVRGEQGIGGQKDRRRGGHVPPTPPLKFTRTTGSTLDREGGEINTFC